MLTDAQRKTIENSLWVVNTALKNQGLSGDEDLRQSAILYMCMCIERFDESRNIKWTTYAYKNVYYFIKRQHKKEIVKSFNETALDLAMPLKGAEMPDFDTTIIDQLKVRCSAIERQIIELNLQGYGQKEMIQTIKCTYPVLHQHIEDIKSKARQIPPPLIAK